jgi:hypothetical protein
MSNVEKVAITESAKDDYSITDVWVAVELSRLIWYYHHKLRKDYTKEYAHLREPLEVITHRHPADGYRRTTEELRKIYDHKANHKAAQRLQQEWGLTLMRSIKSLKLSVIRKVIAAAGGQLNLVAEKEEIGHFEVVYKMVIRKRSRINLSFVLLTFINLQVNFRSIL